MQLSLAQDELIYGNNWTNFSILSWIKTYNTVLFYGDEDLYLQTKCPFHKANTLYWTKLNAQRYYNYK